MMWPVSSRRLRMAAVSARVCRVHLPDLVGVYFPGVPADVAWTPIARRSYAERAKLYRSVANSLDAELMGGVLPHHSGDQSLWYIGIAQLGYCIPGARCIVVRVTRAPDDLRCKIMRQFPDQPFLGIKAEHDIAVLPHFLGFGADRMMMQ